MDKQLRLLAAQIVYESELTKLAKLQMLNYIKEATDVQIKALLMDGEIVKVDEESETVINDRFEVSEAGGRVAKLRKSYMSQAGAGGGMNVFWLAYRKIRSLSDACTKKCGKYEINTSRRQHCMARCKVSKYSAMIAAAKKANKPKEVKKAQAKLVKAQAVLKKSTESFKKRNVNI